MTKMVWHKSLQNRFHGFPVHHQLLMVANELNRAQNLINDPQEYKNCLERALELMDLFLADKSGSLLRETLRLRDIIAKSYIGEPDEVATIKNTLLQMNPTAWTMLIKYSRWNPKIIKSRTLARVPSQIAILRVLNQWNRVNSNKK